MGSLNFVQVKYTEFVFCGVEAGCDHNADGSNSPLGTSPINELNGVDDIYLTRHLLPRLMSKSKRVHFVDLVVPFS